MAHHAGATPQDYTIYGDYFSSLGYVVISIDYYSFFHELGPPLFPDPVRAFKTAIEFIRKNAMTFGCYTGKIAGIGFSEGAMHWAETISWDNDDAYFNTDPLINDHLDAVICYYGLYDKLNHLESPFFTDEGNESLIADYFSPNPLLRATKGNPMANIANITTPVMLYHGTSDVVWSSEQAVEFYNALIANGKSSVLKLLPGRDHIFDCKGTVAKLNFQMDHLTSDGKAARDTVLAYINKTLQVNNIHCPEKKSYWKNHSSEWNVDAIPMKLGTTYSYSKPQLQAILNASAGNDPSKKLAQELIAAKLNIANNSYAPEIVPTILEADNIIGNRQIPIVPLIASNSVQGNQMNTLENKLSTYNNEMLTPHCRNLNFRIGQIDPLGNFSLRLTPNPFSSSTKINFTLLQSQAVTIQIFDLNGRLIITIANKTFAEGEQQIEWNAKDEKGNEVGAGIYFLKFYRGDFSETKKLFVIK